MLLVCPATALSEAPSRPQPPTLESCQERFAAWPDDRDAAMCFYQCAQEASAREAVTRALTALEARHPDQGWLPLVLGHVRMLSSHKAAEAPYRRAAETFHRLQQAEGEVLAAINLRAILLAQGRAEEARQWTRRVVEVASTSGRPDLRARALMVEASHLYEVELDLGRAFRVLKRAEPLVFPEGTEGMKKQYLSVMGTVSERLGRLDEASDINARLVELTRSTGDLFLEAHGRFTLANLALRRLEREHVLSDRGRALALARQALAAAERTGNTTLVARAARLTADLLGDSPEEHREADVLLARCLALPETPESQELRLSCLWTRAERRAGVDPAGAIQDSEASLRLASERNDPLYLALALRGRGTVAYRTQPLPEALAHAERAVDALEALRQTQSDASSQAELFATWARDYHRLAGWTLEAGGATGRAHTLSPRAALSRTFAVSERLRARTLLDALVASRALVDAEDTPERRAQRSEVQSRLVAVQRRLLDPLLTGAGRDAALKELQELERRERDLRPVPRQGALEFASLDAVEQGLEEDEALLVFLVGDDVDLTGTSAGGAWVLVVTRAGTRVHRIPERTRLAAAATLFSGLVERRDGSELGAAVALHAQLLGPALAGLPATVRRLLLVPDGPLHDLPFAALREHREGAPLVARYELGVVPSASLWRHWRGDAPPTLGGEALVLADPEWVLGHGESRSAAASRSGIFEEAALLGALPEARREGFGVEEALRDAHMAPRLWVGPEASERALKDADLSRVRVLHMAAHAVVDAEAPERSALVLTPGTEEEDGILQPREISRLRLNGALVVLSACSSASGAVLPGEGVLSLSRAFFEAGARAVVASLWPLRDAEAADLMERFYRHLATGMSVSAALRAAQLEASDAGLPPAAWAGLVVLGDAGLVATAPREEAAPLCGLDPALLMAAALVVLLALGFIARGRWRGGRAPAATRGAAARRR
ncbi:CHAT domain-containing tetratricopeptide repeat protein [Corallococcus macrosporus]|uniref:CHAT domain-containing protein n=1 Tax=Corallococcus macrosporus DSM 14697 TaxID=1189310 RepID=A0A250JT88_9BACT|nr:CHAT domain-containing protein [Corallococcus macrosporus]ATB46581.1 CHAT domain-containing protein [Corallococcus macrosporus DSM 14697]